MDKSIKTIFTKIGKLDYFNEIIEKLTLNNSLTQDEKVYILSCAILFEHEYQKDNRIKSFLEIAYYIILKYSISTGDYEPLYDMSLNFGYYPISKFILEKNLLVIDNIQDFIVSKNINLYKNPLENFIETHEQYSSRNALLKDDHKEVSFIAPTSYGKSSIIKEHIQQYNYKKIGIIVPSKSLLNQTYKLIKEQNLKYRLIIHDDMYQSEERFIAILTQERALRLLDKHEIYFDTLYIDEAHNLFEKDYRNILLYRLIKQNKLRNPNQSILYLSPLINDSEHLKFDKNEYISKYKIEYNIKEPEYFEYRLDKTVYKYNRFTNKFYKIKTEASFYDYIKENSSKKTFIFHRRPVKTELFAKKLADTLQEIELTKEIQSLIHILKNYVHEDFYMLDLIKKGIIYLHAKLPDQIKDYLEYQYKTIPQLKYLVANEVILEGINLPISTMFILSTHGINEKRLTNLIGRVNRLNNIFDKNHGSLELLCPKIHFVNTTEYAGIENHMTKKIELLRSRDFFDDIKNPLLASYDINKLKPTAKQKENIITENQNISQTEQYLLHSPQTEEDKLKQAIIKNGINAFYDMSISSFVPTVLQRINNNKRTLFLKDKDTLTKLYEIFLYDFDNISDFEIKRLQEKPARDYYNFFISNSKKSLNEIVSNQMRYFKAIQNDDSKNIFYFGKSYGEITRNSTSYTNSINNVYINLKTKTDKELVNLVIVKIKMEEDFVSFKLNNFLNLMLSENLITSEEYNMIVYGTRDEEKISLMKIGLPMNILDLLEKDNQLINISKDENNNFTTNKSFNNYKKSLDNFTQFRIDKFL